MRFLVYLLLLPTIYSAGLYGQAHSDSSRIHGLVETAGDLYYSYPDSCIEVLHTAESLLPGIQNPKTKARLTGDIYLLRAEILRTARPSRHKSDSIARIALFHYGKINDHKGISKSYTVLASNAYSYHLYDGAKYYFDKAFTHAMYCNDDRYKSEVFFNTTYLNRQLGNLSKAFESAYSTLRYAEKSGDSVSLAKAYYILSLLNYDLQNYTQARKYIEKSKLYGISDKLHYSKAEIWKASGEILLHSGEKEKSIDAFEKTLQYAIEYNQKCGALQAYTHLGNAFTGLKNWEKAQEYFEKSKSVSDELGVQPAVYLINLAKLYSLMGESEKASKTLSEFLKIRQDEIKTSENIDSYKDISSIYEKIGDHEEALYYFKKWSTGSDSIRNNDNRLLLAEMERRYTIEKKDAEIARKELALSRSELSLARSRNNQMWLGILLILVCAFAGVSVYYFRNRVQKEKQDHEIEMKQHQLNNILAVQEEERRRIARELHDGIGQSLAALKIQLQSPKFTASPLSSLRRIDLLCEEVRSLSHQMMPLILEEKGLEEALSVLIEQSFDPKRIDTHYISNGFENRLEEKQEVHLYRIAQELLYNVSKHAGACEVGVQLLQNDNRIILAIEDNGAGFNVEDKKDGIGLVNVNSRLEVLGGKMEIDSKPGTGTYIRITIPLAQKDRKSA